MESRILERHQRVLDSSAAESWDRLLSRTTTFPASNRALTVAEDMIKE